MLAATEKFIYDMVATRPMVDVTGVRWCSKCQVLLRDVQQAACGAGDYHDPTTSGRYFLSTTPNVGESAYKSGWRSCRFCRSVFMLLEPPPPPPTDLLQSQQPSVLSPQPAAPWAPAEPWAPPRSSAPAGQFVTARPCPAYGGQGFHGDDGVPLLVRLDDGGSAEQKGWRLCSKCFALFFSDNGGANGSCPVDHAPHEPDDQPLVVEFEHLATFPWPRALGKGKQVEFKYQGALDLWQGVGKGTWWVCSPTELFAESDWGGTFWGVHLTMVHGPKCWVDWWVSAEINILGVYEKWVQKAMASPPAIPCFNPGNFDPTDDQVEWNNGQNNNGVELKLEAGVAVAMLWPKSTNRIRIDIQQLVPQTADEMKEFNQLKKDHPSEVWLKEYHFELDTQE